MFHCQIFVFGEFIIGFYGTAWPFLALVDVSKYSGDNCEYSGILTKLFQFFHTFDENILEVTNVRIFCGAATRECVGSIFAFVDIKKKK